MAASQSRTFKFAACQVAVGADKDANLASAAAAVAEAASNGAKMVALPECFNCPYGNDYFPDYAEPVDGASAAALSAMARDNGVYLIGGSFPEKDGDNLYNTSLSFGPDGALLATHRKVHLFDIDVPGKITFKESETLTPGASLTSFEAPDLGAKVGVAICYDLRFPELAMLTRRDHGVDMMVYPGAFNMTTGPAHWELLLRARALDNQMWTVAVSPARDEEATYTAWGHSTVVSPWGEVVATTDHDPTIVYADIDLDRVTEVREQIPVSLQKRDDLYRLENLTDSA